MTATGPADGPDEPPGSKIPSGGRERRLTGGGVRLLAECLIRLACRSLPADIRDDRYREWTAELPAILGDPDIRPRIRRDLAAVRFAAGHVTIRMPSYSFTSFSLFSSLLLAGQIASRLADQTLLGFAFGFLFSVHYAIGIYIWRTRRRRDRNRRASG
jgi:hypothetical protein